MNRESLLKRLVDRKLASNTKDRVFCVCVAANPRSNRGRPGTASDPRR